MFVGFIIILMLESALLIHSFKNINTNGFQKYLSSNLKNKNTELSMNGLELGVGTLLTGLIMDNSISKESLESLLEKDSKLLLEGYKKASLNLLLIGPLFYSILVNYLQLSSTFENTNEFYITNFLTTLGIVIIHSIGYYIGHYSMHKFNYLRPVHMFHHKFKDNLIPSIGNSVSLIEFTCVYMLPFVIGAILLKPTLISFDLGIIIVSLFNLIIHCNELIKKEDSDGFFLWEKDLLVSPDKHYNHHNRKNSTDVNGNNIPNTYSAPTINLDKFVEGIFDFKYYIDSIVISVIMYLRP